MGAPLTQSADGRFADVFGVTRDGHGPFWPLGSGALFSTPVHERHLQSSLPNESDTLIEEPMNVADDCGESKGFHALFTN